MKHFLQISFLFFIFSSIVLSQIPNAGFENWSNGDPVGWFTYDLLGDAVTQSSDKHSGSSAAKMQIIDFVGTPIPPILYSGRFAVSQVHGSLTGYYKFAPQNANVNISVDILMYQGTTPVGGGFWETYQPASSYVQFTVPIDYISTTVPDSAYIQIAVVDTSAGSTGIGSYALIDDLGFGGFVDVKEISNSQLPISYNLRQNYPNPFNPSTKIEYSIPEESFVNLKVYNLIGEEVATLVNQYQKAGIYRAEFNAEGLNSGVYIAKLTANGFTRSIKMTLMK